MRVGIFSQWFDPEPGPASLPGALARALRDRGHPVQVVTGFPNYPSGHVADGYRISPKLDEVVDGIRIRRTALYPSHDRSVIGRVVNWCSFSLSSTVLGVRALRSVDAVWISNSPITIALPAWVIARLLRKPTVLHVLDLWPDNVQSSGLVRAGIGTKAVVAALHLVARGMYKTATRIAVVSPGSAAILRSRGVPREKIDIVPLWAEESKFFPGDGHALRAAMGVGIDQVVVLYAGALGGTQEVETLVDACAMRTATDEPIELWIAGSGVRESIVRAKMLALDDTRVRARFLGRVPMEEMASIMHAADVHFVGLRDDSLARITMPSKLQATMASAKPMIIAVPGDAESVVLESGAGFAAAPGRAESIADAISEAVSLGRDGLAAAGARARAAYVARFSLARGAAAIERCLERAMGM